MIVPHPRKVPGLSSWMDIDRLRRAARKVPGLSRAARKVPGLSRWMNLDRPLRGQPFGKSRVYRR
jgi:hypothetical protein